MQGANPRPTLEKELGHVTDSRKLLKVMCNGSSPQRKEAMAVHFFQRGIKCSLIRSFLSKDSLKSETDLRPTKYVVPYKPLKVDRVRTLRLGSSCVQKDS